MYNNKNTHILIVTNKIEMHILFMKFEAFLSSILYKRLNRFNQINFLCYIKCKKFDFLNFPIILYPNKPLRHVNKQNIKYAI